MPSDLELHSAIVAASDVTWRNHFRHTVAECGLAPLVSRSGTEAVSRARSTSVSLVILGMLMPNMNAPRTCAMIRDLPLHAATPIIIVLPSQDPRLEAAAIRAGASLLLTLPLSTFQLRQGILPLLGVESELAPLASEWQRMREPSPLYAEPTLLTRGREMLKIDRQISGGVASRRINWRR